MSAAEFGNQVEYADALAAEMWSLGAIGVTRELVLDALASTGYALRESPGEATDAYYRLIHEQGDDK